VLHLEPSALVSASDTSISDEKPGRERLRGGFLKNERKTNRQRRNTSAPNEGLADASPVPVACEGLPRVEMSQELSFLGTGASFARAKGRASGVGRLFVRAHMDNSVEPQVLAVVPLPSAIERLTSFLRTITRAGDASGDAMTRYKS
jgi:hypothetical protein